jgi:hypothetical protein
VVVRNRTDTRPLTGVQRVTTGGYHSCAVLTNRQARCWGSGTAGELGSGPPGSSSSLPVIVVNPSGSGPLTGVRAVDEGYSHTCVRLTNGQARCWGEGQFGRLGSGTADRPLPTRVDT